MLIEIGKEAKRIINILRTKKKYDIYDNNINYYLNGGYNEG